MKTIYILFRCEEGDCQIFGASRLLHQKRQQSPSVMERWGLKIQALEEKKRHYEDILRRELTGLDDEFSTLKLLRQELSLRAQGLRFRKAA